MAILDSTAAQLDEIFLELRLRDAEQELAQSTHQRETVASALQEARQRIAELSAEIEKRPQSCATVQTARLIGGRVYIAE